MPVMSPLRFDLLDGVEPQQSGQGILLQVGGQRLIALEATCDEMTTTQHTH